MLTQQRWELDMRDGAENATALKTRPIASVDDVKRIVAGYFRITVKQLEGPSRSPRFVHPRHVAMALAYRRLHKTGVTFEAIGNAIGRRHHSTVIFACRKFGIEADPNHPARRMSARRARASVPMRPCKPPVLKPPPANVRTAPRTPEEIRRAYWMRQCGFARPA